MTSSTKAMQDPTDPGAEDDEPFEVEYRPEAEAGDGVLAAKNSHESELLAISGVQGVGVGKTPIGDDAITVYVKEQAVVERLPKALDGYPVEATVVGEIEAF